jgi:FkbM family methyltransferase
LPRGTPIVLQSRFAKYPLVCRAGASDVDVFSQIFVTREYRCLDNVREAGLIIDCGANVGYSSAYFLTAYPSAALIAVEPDPENFRLLAENLKAYGARVSLRRAAIWSKPTTLSWSLSDFGDGREWARSVSESKGKGNASIPAIDIGSLLAASGRERISILKIDIEGAESVVFSENYAWLSRVDNLVIELHSEECKTIFHRAIAAEDFVVSECEELTVCQRTSRVKRENPMTDTAR